ncbi:MAG: recombination mediator RecR [Planctomycetota bacterium]|jgi:recombination protein RecR
MAHYAKAIEDLIERLGRLPGIGARSAERLAFYLLKSSDDDANGLADAIRKIKTEIHPCRQCFNLAEQELCAICADPQRDPSTIAVVEQPKDLLALEAVGAFRGVYHVLMGHIAPLEGVEADDLTIDALVARVKAGGIKEVILATNPTVSGDGTALCIHRALEPFDAAVTRLARGLPTGGSIEYANKSILADAINERRELS